MSPNPALLTWPRPVAGGAGGPLAASYRAAPVSAADLTTYTFSSVDIGTPSAGRSVLVAVAGRAAGIRTISSVTIAGVGATIDYQASNNAGGNTSLVAFARAAVPSGATGNVVVTWSGPAARCGIGVWAITGDPDPLDFDSTPSDATTLTLDSAADGLVFGAAFDDGVSVSWSGLTQRYALSMEAGGGGMSGGDASTSAGTVGVSLDWTGAGSYLSAAITYAPA